jgi:hypothetical protein
MRSGWPSIAVSALIVTAACKTGSGTTDRSLTPHGNAASYEETTMIRASRGPPPRVPPVVHNGVRYEQIMNADALGYDQVTGYLAAFDDKSGARLWVAKVYDVPIDENLERDVQDTFFTKLEFVPGKNQLLIENEAGETFIFDPKLRSASRVGPPARRFRLDDPGVLGEDDIK